MRRGGREPLGARAARPAVLVLLAMLPAGCLASGPAPVGEALREPFAVAVPFGLDIVAPVPDDNPLTAAKVELGRRLFFDPILSRDGTMSCASCHVPERYFTDGQTRAKGVAGYLGRRNVPSLLNVAYGRSFGWDGGITRLEEQALRPIGSPIELDLELGELERRLRRDRAYRAAFEGAFGASEPTAADVARALASYLRTLRSGNAPIDRFLGGDTTALSAAARRGFRLFSGKANCSSCHIAPLFTDHRFYNTGVAWRSDDVGRFAVTGEERDRGAFKVPSLRNVAQTAPYMHDGSLTTLEDVIAHYDRGGTPDPYLDPEIAPLRLTASQRAELLAFLESLTQQPGPSRQRSRAAAPTSSSCLRL